MKLFNLILLISFVHFSLSRNVFPKNVPECDGKENNLSDCGSVKAKREASDGSEPRSCQEWVLKYTFDQESQSCRANWFGGCDNLGANEIKYETGEECEVAQGGGNQPMKPHQESAGDVCGQQGEVAGECGEWTMKYSYDAASKSCRGFWYGGCGGNDNRFESNDDCEAACGEKKEPEDSFDQSRQNQEDQLRRNQEEEQRRNQEEEQRRRQEEEQRRQNEDQGRHEEDQGRHHGNQGRPRENDQVRPNQGSENSGSACEQPKEDAGDCGEWVIKFSFDAERGSCRAFYYGGCGGNENNFGSQEDCESICVQQQNEVGQTGSDFSGHYSQYEREQGRPGEEQGRPYENQGRPHEDQDQDYQGRPHEDHGRRTNEDHGRRPHDDHHQQDYERPQPRPNQGSFQPFEPHHQNSAGACDQPKEVPGDCDEWVIKYSFNADDKSCNGFYYGGCVGNENNFGTVDECEAACVNKHEEFRAFTTTEESTERVTTTLMTSTQAPRGFNARTTVGTTLRPVLGVDAPAECTDDEQFANCQLIVKGNYCGHAHYSKFCCKSCKLAGLI